MALTSLQFHEGLRIDNPDSAQITVLGRIKAVSEELCARYAPNAPEAVCEHAVISVGAYLYDSPQSGDGPPLSIINAFRASGAQAMLSTWRSHGIAVAGGDVSSTTPGTPGTPVGVDEAAVLALFSVWAQAGDTSQIPASKLLNAPTGQGGGGVDTAARTAAATAQSTAEGAQDRADSAFTDAGLAHNQANNAQTTAAGKADLADVDARVDPWARTNSTDTIDPPSLFGPSPTPNRYVTVNTAGRWQLVTAPTGGGGDPVEGGVPVTVTDLGLINAFPVVAGFIFADLGIDIPDDCWMLAGLDRNGQEWFTFPSLLPVSTVGANNLGIADPPPFVISFINSANNQVAVARLGKTADGSILISSNHSLQSANIASRVFAFTGGAGGAGGGGGVDAGAVNTLIAALVANWAIEGNTGTIPSNKLPYLVEPWARGEEDIPFSALDTVLETWAVKAVAPLEIIPNARLPIARFLPSPTSLADGQIAKVESGIWISADEASLTGVAAKTWRVEYERAEDILDPLPPEHVGKVFIRLRFLDTYDSAGTRTASQDLGNGFLTSTGSRTISVSNALDVRGLLARSSVSAVMQLVTSLPTAANASWGEWYGLSDSDGKVEDIYFRREESTTEQLWLPARLDSQSRDIHGYNDLSVLGVYAFERGGGLSPTAQVVQLVEERDANGNISTRLIIPKTSPLNSAISVLMYYKSGAEIYNTSREVTLVRDSTFTSSVNNRYASPVYQNDFKFVPGNEYIIKWRNAGQAHDLILHAEQQMRRVADDEDLDTIRATVQKEIYEVEDKVTTGATARTALEAKVTALQAQVDALPTTTPAPVSATFSPTLVGSVNISIGSQNIWYSSGINLPSDYASRWFMFHIGDLNDFGAEYHMIRGGALSGTTRSNVGDSVSGDTIVNIRSISSSSSYRDLYLTLGFSPPTRLLVAAHPSAALDPMPFVCYVI